MSEPTTKSEILDLIQNERQLLDKHIASLSDEQLIAPALENDRSVQDILAHITAWEKKMLLVLAQAFRGENPNEEWDNFDAINEQIYQDNRSKPLAQVRSESAVSYELVVAAVSIMSEADLFDETGFAWRSGSPLVNLVEGNTWDHYAEHRQEIARAFPG